jgi:hypothetical protein
MLYFKQQLLFNWPHDKQVQFNLLFYLADIQRGFKVPQSLSPGLDHNIPSMAWARSQIVWICTSHDLHALSQHNHSQ